MNTQISKHKLLVLVDSSKESHDTLKNAADLVKLIGGSLEIFQVKKPDSLINSENQIAAVRTIQDENFKTKKELKNIIDPILEKEKVSISFNFTYGNTKNEIKTHIKKTNPDAVILGKRKKNIIPFLGDGITKYLLKNHNGAILISGNEEAFKTYSNKFK